MSDIDRLVEEWFEDENGLRVRRIQKLRDEIHDATGLVVPRSPAAIETWLLRFQSQVTKKLNKHREEDSDTEK